MTAGRVGHTAMPGTAAPPISADRHSTIGLPVQPPSGSPPIERAMLAAERPAAVRSGRGRTWLLVGLTAVVWLGLVVALVIGALLTRQPPLAPVPVGG